MNKLFSIMIILFMFAGTVNANINGHVKASDRPLENLNITLSKMTMDQNEGSVYSFEFLSSTTTDKDGRYEFTTNSSETYRLSVTYQNLTSGKNANDGEIVDFNLSGTITGFVFPLESLHSEIPAGIPVSLWDEDGVSAGTTLTEDTGKYVFTGVNTGNYTVVVTYLGVPYVKDLKVSGNSGADFRVYDTTYEDNIISISADHVLLSRAPEGILVHEFVEFKNTGNKVFYSPERVWLGISTPSAISNFKSDVMECCLVILDDVAWIDPMRPIMPGEKYGTRVSYIFNPQSGPVIFNKKSIYDIFYLSVLSETNNGLGIESTNSKKETISDSGKEFEILSFTDVPGGQPLDIKITGLALPEKGTEEDFNYLIPLLAIALIGAVCYPLIRNMMTNKDRRRFIEPSVPATADDPEEESRNRDELKGIIEERIEDIERDERS